MQSEKFHLSVNLKQRPDEGLPNIFLKWAVNSGRIIIVVVELLTLSALGFRFFVDSKIVDLHDKIQKDQFFIERLTEKENSYRSIQKRLDIISTLENQNASKVGFLKQLTENLSSSDFSDTNLSISNDTIGISGKTYTVFTLNSLVDQLKSNPNVVSISIDNLNSVDQGLEFKLTTQLKQTDANL